MAALDTQITMAGQTTLHLPTTVSGFIGFFFATTVNMTVFFLSLFVLVTLAFKLSSIARIERVLDNDAAEFIRCVSVVLVGAAHLVMVLALLDESGVSMIWTVAWSSTIICAGLTGVAAALLIGQTLWSGCQH